MPAPTRRQGSSRTTARALLFANLGTRRVVRSSIPCADQRRVLLCMHSGATLAGTAAAKLLAHRLIRAGQEAPRRCRCCIPSRRQLERAGPSPVARAALLWPDCHFTREGEDSDCDRPRGCSATTHSGRSRSTCRIDMRPDRPGELWERSLADLEHYVGPRWTIRGRSGGTGTRPRGQRRCEPGRRDSGGEGVC